MGDVVAVGRGGLHVGRQGFGGAPLGGLFASVDGRDAAATLEEAWAQGIRYFDTAPHYGAGLSERRVGEFLAGKPYGEWVLSTKVGRVLESARPEEADDAALRR